MTSYEFGRALVYIAEQIIKTFGEDFGIQLIDQDAIDLLESKNAYLKGKVKAYEKFLKDKGYMEGEDEAVDIKA